MTEVLDRDTEELLDAIRQYNYRRRKEADEAIKGLRHHLKQRRDAIERLWRATKTIYRHNIMSIDINEAMYENDIDALEVAIKQWFKRTRETT
jgi:hypothetical protein